MASCFKNPNKKNLSAKDYTIKKRRSTLFCNLRENALNNIHSGMVPLITIGNNEACVDKDGIFFKYRNHKSQIDMLRAFEDFREKDLIGDVSGQLFKNHFCPPYDISTNNIGISNNYTSNIIESAYEEGTGNVHVNTYAEIKPGTSDYLEGYPSGFKNNKFFLLKPPVCNSNTRPHILKVGDVSEPQASETTLLIEF